MYNPYEVVRRFEEAVAEWAGAPYAVAVESGSAAIFLSCVYRCVHLGETEVPALTYPSVPCAVIHAGGRLRFADVKWDGEYELKPWGIVDSALSFLPKMYKAGTLRCLSFHGKKHLPIGRGGMILTDDPLASAALRRMRFDGRGEVPLLEDVDFTLGWNMYMTPEQAVRGLQLFNVLKALNPTPRNMPVADQGYADLRQFEVYRQGGRWFPTGIRCASCGLTPSLDPKVSLTRVNRKGINGVWVCGDCLPRPEGL